MIPLADWPTLSLAPAISLWLLIPGLFLAVGLSIYLYAEQKRIASGFVVILLSLIRIALIVMLAILFMQPALRWESSHTNAGTLWLLIDQSPSMQTPDPQATPVERIKWAQGMGLLTDRERPDHPDTLQAEIHALSGEFAAIVNVSASADERTSVMEFARTIRDWSDRLVKARRDASTLDGGREISSSLSRALSLAQESFSPIHNSASLREAKTEIDSITIDQDLAAAEKAAAALAAATDARFLSDKAANPQVTSAAARVTNASRADLAFDFLADPNSPAAKRLAELAARYHVRIASFADKAQTTGAAGGVEPSDIPDTLKAALAPAGQSTNLDNALQFISQQIATDEAASVVIVTDGRNNGPGDPMNPAQNLGSRDVRVFGLLVGSHEVSADAAVDQIDAPDWVYKGDTIKARALIRLDGLQGKSAVVEIRRGSTLVKRNTVFARDKNVIEPIEFSDKPPDTDLAVEYEVRVSEMPGEVNTQNNVSTFRVAIKKDKLVALFIEDRPRWEYRYLAATLVRDQRMKIQTVLLNPALIAGITPPPAVRASPDNPLDEAQLLPVTPEEWQAFDIIILGDVSPDSLSFQSQQYIGAAVRDKGATLITIAGQRSMPMKYSGTPLADLLPVTLNPQWSADLLTQHNQYGFQPAIAPTAGASILAQFSSDTGGRAHAGLPPWYWHSPYTQAKPAASVIWSINELSRAGIPVDPADAITEANRHALLATMNIGLGRSLYLASDQTWRLRQVGGENVHERFWGQVLRWAVGSDLPAGGKYVRFGASQPTYTQDQPAIITARILRDDLTPYTGLAFSATARAVKPLAGEPGQSPTVEARFTPMESPGYYTATLGGLPAGDVEISLKGPEVERLLDSDPSVTQKTLLIKVEPELNAERRNMNTNPTYLEQLARAGGGFSLDANYADQLFSHLPEIKHTETVASQIGFFTDPEARGTLFAHGTFLITFALLLSAEWFLRKPAGLV